MMILGKVKRMDSAMISVNCRRLSRVSLMHITVRGMVERLRKDNVLVPDQLRKYVKKNEHQGVEYRLKRDDINSRMEEILQDALYLADYCAAQYADTSEYSSLIRMIDEQSKETDSGQRILKENNEISPSSMQNPSDEDATNREKSSEKHVGYVVNIVEDCSENGNLITDYDYKQNSHSDVEFAKEYIESLPENNDVDVLITDGAYGSSETLDLAIQRGCSKLQSPSLFLCLRR